MSALLTRHRRRINNLMDHLMSVNAGQKERIAFAASRSDFEAVFRLGYKEYLRKGYCDANEYEMRVTPYHALADSVTICLWRDSALVASATLVLDSPLGLPMEKVYPDEIQKLRSEGRKMCEVTLLSLNSDLIKEGIFSIYYAERLRCLYQVFKPLFWYAKSTIKFTDLCIACNPKHLALYSSLYFKQFGEERVYESVKGNPSIALRLDFDHLEERVKRTPGLFKLFFGRPLQLKNISEVFRWNAEDFEYFFAQKSDVLRSASDKEIEYISTCYPAFPVMKWAGRENI